MSLKKHSTMWPNMMGSETFIMVAFKWMEHRTPCALQSSIWAVRNSRKAFLLMKDASITSPQWYSR
eukprot:802978-Amphidinium_carterae.1